jgi:hypothetical protein
MVNIIIVVIVPTQQQERGRAVERRRRESRFNHHDFSPPHLVLGTNEREKLSVIIVNIIIVVTADELLFDRVPGNHVFPNKKPCVAITVYYCSYVSKRRSTTTAFAIRFRFERGRRN